MPNAQSIEMSTLRPTIDAPKLTVSSEAENDLLRVLRSAGYACERVDTPARAVGLAPAGGAVLILAAGYPQNATALDAELFAQAAARKLRMYVEYPASLPGLAVGERVAPSYDRAVIASDFFGKELPALRILSIHGLNYLPVDAAAVHMRSARVAGFDTAVFLFESDARKGGRGDPNHGAYGLIAWGTSCDAWLTANYGDDNARLMFGTAATAAILDDHRWDEALVMCLLANLRTTGREGFRSDRIDMPALGRHSWEHFFHRSLVSYSPHMESWLWACYLWAYARTGFELFYDRAVTALGMTMRQYPDGLRWTNGLAPERARILLPLAWLLRVKDTPEHRAWFKTAVDGLLALQDDCGAIREELGQAGKGMYPQPTSNAGYGTSEAPLIQQNGDPVADLLYTSNFAFLALNEAAAALAANPQ